MYEMFKKRITDTQKSREILNINCSTSLEVTLEEIVPWIIQQIELVNI
jgi:hypothetical protein